MIIYLLSHQGNCVDFSQFHFLHKQKNTKCAYKYCKHGETPQQATTFLERCPTW